MEQTKRNNNSNYNDYSNDYIDNYNDNQIDDYNDSQIYNDNENNSVNSNNNNNNQNKNQNGSQNRNQRQNGNQNGVQNPNATRSNNNASQNQNNNKNIRASQEDINFLELNAAQILDLLKQSVGASRRMSGSVSRTENYLNELSQFSSTITDINTATSKGVTREEFGSAINYVVKESANNNQLIINHLKQVSTQLQGVITYINQANRTVNPNQIGTNINAKAQTGDSNYIEIPLPKIGKVKVDVKFVKPALIAAFFIFTVLVLLIRR